MNRFWLGFLLGLLAYPAGVYLYLVGMLALGQITW